VTLSDEEARWRLALLDTVFRPSAPVDREDLFSGRGSQLASVQEAIGAVGQHAVIFGERGVGKTSLAATSADITRRRESIAMRVNCDQSDNFFTLWQKVIDEFQVVLADKPSPALEAALERATEVLDNDSLGPNHVRVAFRHVTPLSPVVIVFDEFDQMNDQATLSLISNTIKLLSDHIESVTLVAVGVASNVSDLIAGHQSIQRNLVQVRMPRMVPDELEGILDRGLGQLAMTATAQTRSFLRTVPRGLPQYAHLLAQEGARQALWNGEAEITFAHVFDGLQVGLEKLDYTLASAFDEATYSAKPSRFAEVLYACAMVRPDRDGYFSPSAIRQHYSSIIGQQVAIDRYNPHLTALSQARGEILHRRGPERARRYRFANTLMEPYIMLKGLAEGKITPDSLADPSPSDS
jgi:Cdc6-like AAA superfamily ATPase